MFQLMSHWLQLHLMDDGQMLVAGGMNGGLMLYDLRKILLQFIDLQVMILLLKVYLSAKSKKINKS